MDRSLLLRRVAVVFGAICLLLISWYAFAVPKTLRVAVGPADSVQYRYLLAMARALKDTRKSFRLELVTAADSAAASKLLDDRKVNLAVLRSDDASSLEARSIAILEKRSIVMVTRAESGIESMADLAGRTIAILSPGVDKNRAIIERISQHYGASMKELPVDEINVREFVQAPKQYDAYFIIADPASGVPKTAIDAIVALDSGELSFIGMPAPEGLALRLRELHKVTIPAGAFGGSPPKPKEELETVALTYELTATSRLDQADGTELLGALVELRTRMRRLVPSRALDVEPPPVDAPRRFLPHIGAAAYVNDEQAKTFLETYSDQLWLGIFLLSIAGSSVTGFLAWSGFFDVSGSGPKLEARMSQLARRLAAADDPIDLDDAQGEIDDIVVSYLCDYGRSPMDAETQLSLALWTNSLNAIIERRRALARPPDGGEP